MDANEHFDIKQSDTVQSNTIKTFLAKNCYGNLQSTTETCADI